MTESGGKPPAPARGDTMRVAAGEFGPSGTQTLVEDGALTDASAEPTRVRGGTEPTMTFDDELVVGAPEPKDWVRLPDSDPRSAPTQPSMRRRSSVRPHLNASKSTEPNPERRRERYRHFTAFAMGGLVGLLGLAALLVLVRAGERYEVVPSSPAIEAARTPTPVPLPEHRQSALVVAPLEPPSLPEPTEAGAATEAPAPAEARVSPGTSDERAAAPVPARPATGSRSFKPATVGSGLLEPLGPRGPRARSSFSETRGPATSSSSQPKKRLWFPPE